MFFPSTFYEATLLRHMLNFAFINSMGKTILQLFWVSFLFLQTVFETVRSVAVENQNFGFIIANTYTLVTL